MSGEGESSTKPTLEAFKQSFREYLKETKVVDNESELEQLMTTLHEPLPISFRFNLHRSESKQAMEAVASDLQFDADTYSHNDISINPPTEIAWYPQSKVAWELSCGRSALSKSAPKFPDVKRFHSFLLKQTELGTIDRQEAVSMLPVLFLNVQPTHAVLDMCASPGSKTTQILDFLTTDASSAKNGLVIANDLDRKRAYMLVHRLTRNTLRRAVVTCGPGDQFPGLYVNNQLEANNVLDRVLCDVPCSGDGTVRKDARLWRDWHIGQGLTLHQTQLSLALRSASLLKIDGLMVYSTCSMSPVEDEAVLSELLRRCDGAMEVVDVKDQLPRLVTRPGRTMWPVGWRSKSKSSKKGHEFSTAAANAEVSEMYHEWFQDYDSVPSELKGNRLLRSMFPSKEGWIQKQVEKSMRLVPIDQNTGGFFIAVLKKVRNLPGANQEGLGALEEDMSIDVPEDYVCKLCGKSGHLMKQCENYVPDDEYRQPKRQKVEGKKKGGKRETLYRRISDNIWNEIKDYYGLSDMSLKERLWCRSDGAASINYVDAEIEQACLAGDALDIVNTGLRVFSKITDHGTSFYRPVEEALGFIDGYFSCRVLRLNAEDFELVLKTKEHLSFTSLSDTCQKELVDVPKGPAVVQLTTDTTASFNVWIGEILFPRLSKDRRAELQANFIDKV